ncbi:hypothetical protein, partial [Alistipes sp. ZOR0009]|uniref:hypothetical protein n=1 Tax=Alistipes sp. ZOR0009 TaxID=1339253 RepID=UPI000648C457
MRQIRGDSTKGGKIGSEIRRKTAPFCPKREPSMRYHPQAPWAAGSAAWSGLEALGHGAQGKAFRYQGNKPKKAPNFRSGPLVRLAATYSPAWCSSTIGAGGLNG